MNFDELVSKRYSVRKFSSNNIEDEKLEMVLEAARKAPSAVNFQPYRLYVIKSEKMFNEITECYHRSWIKTAQVVIAVIGLHETAWKRTQDAKDHTDIDVAIAIEHIMLQAADLGLGTCCVCNFDVEKCSDVLNLKPTEEPIALIPLGYPESDDIPVKKRKDMEELVVRL